MDEGLVWEIVHIPTDRKETYTLWARPWESHKAGHPKEGTAIIPHGGPLRLGPDQLVVKYIATLFGEQTYGITVSRLAKGTRTILNARPLPDPVIRHSSSIDINPSPWQNLQSKQIAKFTTKLADI